MLSVFVIVVQVHGHLWHSRQNFNEEIRRCYDVDQVDAVLLANNEFLGVFVTVQDLSDTFRVRLAILIMTSALCSKRGYEYFLLSLFVNELKDLYTFRSIRFPFFDCLVF